MEVDSNEVERSDLDADTEVNDFIQMYIFLIIFSITKS